MTFEVRNRIAIAAWVFMAVWLSFLLIFTWLMLRDGPHPSQPAALQQGVLALFWLFGIGGSAHVFALPCTRFAVAADGSARLGRWSPLARETEHFPPGSIAAVELRRGRDSDGDPYFRATLVAADGRERVIREGHDADQQREVIERVRRALGLD